MAKTFRIFISSPSDVFAERERVERVILRLNGEFGGGLLEAIRWERAYYTAAKTFQDQIPLPSETDLVVCILWKRLGFELPADYRRADGTTPTGTEYEFENAMAAAKSKGTPDVLVYRKAAPVLLNAEQVEVERAQFEALKLFWSRWFRSETGNFIAAYQSFETTDQFETDVETHIRQWLARHDVESAGATWRVELQGSPFRGLQAFDAAHAPVFFGRRRVVERALERLADAARRGTPFLLVLGPSGAGKSSVARAGLQPRLTQPGTVPGIDVWRCCTMRPSEGDTPLHGLARALYRTDALPELSAGDSPAPDDFAKLLEGSPEAGARAIRLALGRSTAAIAAREGFDRPVMARLLLTVDQFEEALASPQTRDTFARALTALAASGAVWIVATLRSDLYAAFQACAPLLALRDAGAQFDLLPPSGAELAETVTGPAAAAGLRFEARADGTGLDDELIAAATQPFALPLLQLALDALFEARDPATNLLTCAAYDAGGGLSGVVERRGEATLRGLDEAARAALPAVLRGLVEVTEDGVVTSRTAAVPPTPAERRLVDAFVAARLLVSGTASTGAPTGRARIRVAHDAVLSGWPRAAELIEADREMLRIRGRVEAAARRWMAEQHNADYLLPPGRPLAEAVEFAATEPDGLDANIAAFIAASREADSARIAAAQAHAQRELRLEAEAQQARADAATRIVRRTRAATGVVSVLLLLAAGTAVYAYTQRDEARQQTVAAERNFKAALDGGASLIAAVDAHLGDGGMTRRVARELLATADQGIGSLLPRGSDATLPPPLLDTDSRLQASFSRVIAATCGGAEARTRAERAVSVAEAALRQAPSDDRALALMMATDELGHAFEAESDWAGARGVFERAEAIAAGHTGDTWKDDIQKVRRDLAYTMSDGKDRRRTAEIVRDDLAWQQTRLAGHPDQPDALGEAAADYRQLGIVARADNDVAALGAALDSEADILRRLALLQPANVNWQRYWSANARAKSLLLYRQGDVAGALDKARQAAIAAAAVVAHDPENALWRIGAISADIGLSIALLHTGDEAGARAVLRPDMDAVKALAAPGSSVMCRTEAAQMQSAIGNAMIILGSGDEAIEMLDAGVALARSMAKTAPGDPAMQHLVVDAEIQLARVLVLAKRPARVVEHAQAGIAALTPLLSAQPANAGWQAELAQLRLYKADAQLASNELDAAIATYAEDRGANETLIAAYPGEGRWRVALGTVLLRIGEAQFKAGRPDEQWAAYQAASAALAPLAGTPDMPPDWQRTIIDVHQHVGIAALARQQLPAALAELQQALSAADALAATHPADLQSRTAQAQALLYMAVALRIDGQADKANEYDARGRDAFAKIKAGG